MIFLKTIETSRNTMALQVNEVFGKHGLIAQVIACAR
jgi:hypothetical protein